MELIVEAQPFQKRFLDSQAKFPCLCAGVGTGKTYMMLLKVWNHCQEYPGSVGLVVRKEFCDLRDSTIKDFIRYFGVDIDSNKEYRFHNGSVIMFRHGAELDVLKNMSLSIIAGEQMEEFDTEEQFTYLRDRLRHPIGTRQLCIICNANGHNWIWKLWKNNPPSSDYDIVEANTFDNADNLPQDFVNDLKRMEVESPNHYKRFVMNSHEELDADDLLLTHSVVYNAPALVVYPGGTQKRVLAVDVARFGTDETVFNIIESRGVFIWEQIYLEAWRDKSLMETVGKIVDIQRTFGVDAIVIDDTGMGGGVTDRLREFRLQVIPFLSGGKANQSDVYDNRRAEGFFKLQEMMNKGYLKIKPDQALMDQLLTIRYKFRSSGHKAIVSKDDMRKDGLKSPDRADALMMAVAGCDSALDARQMARLPRQAVD